jgi:hypothetical protein
LSIMIIYRSFLNLVFHFQSELFIREINHSQIVVLKVFN